MKKTFSTTVAILVMYCVAQAQTNTSYGVSAGSSGFNNSNFGYYAGAGSAFASENSFFGSHAGEASTGMMNTGVGAFALRQNTTGVGSVALGYNALSKSTTAVRNTALGADVLFNNITGDDNTATGNSALFYNTSGFQNTADGSFTLYRNTTGRHNAATGTYALNNNTTGIGNTAHGYLSLYMNDGGGYNVAVGREALRVNVSGNYNTAVGYLSGTTLDNLTNTLALGFNTKTTASNQVRIGNANVTSIGGQVEWSTLSDGRFKKELKEDVGGLDFIKQLRPVSYVVDKNAVNKFLGTPDSVVALAKATEKPVRQVGFVAQEVEALVKRNGYVFSGVEAPQNNHDTYAIRYAQFVVPLVKAVQELSARVDELTGQLLEKAEAADVVSADGVAKGEVLHQNAPNPFSSVTKIGVSLPEGAAQAMVIVYNMEGKQLKVMPVQGRGETSVQIQGHELAAGMYYYALVINGKVAGVKRMILTGN